MDAGDYLIGCLVALEDPSGMGVLGGGVDGLAFATVRA